MSEHSRRALVMRGTRLQKYWDATAYVEAFTAYERAYDPQDANSVSRAVSAACHAYIEQLAREGKVASQLIERSAS